VNLSTKILSKILDGVTSILCYTLIYFNTLIYLISFEFFTLTTFFTLLPIDLFIDFLERTRDSLKKMGAIRPIAKLLADPALTEDEAHMIDILVLITFVVTTDENREMFRTVNGMSRLPGILVYEKNNEVSKLVTTALVELSTLSMFSLSSSPSSSSSLSPPLLLL
jgi:hypothetical protein